MKNKLEKLQRNIIQGGMGVGISLGGLSGSVAKEGAMGVISSVGIGFKEKDYLRDSQAANLRALEKEFNKAREISEGRGLIGVNIMQAVNNYKSLIKKSCELGFDAIIMGAGLATDLASLADKETMIAPIVSSKRALRIIMKTWKKRADRLPDFIVVEGPKAGGHLGFSYDDLTLSLKDILADIVGYLKEEKLNIPIFAAGGIEDRQEKEELEKIGAFGIQLGTNFLMTKECDASEDMKKFVAEQEEQVIIHSPVGMPARAIKNKFTDLISKKRVPSKRCMACLRPCKPATTQFCIHDALIRAVKGDVENGLFFTGNKRKTMKIQTVKEVIDSF